MIDRFHVYKLHEWVDVLPSTQRTAAPGRYQIVRLIPRDANEPRYCVRSAREKYERVVSEYDLTRSADAVV